MGRTEGTGSRHDGRRRASRRGRGYGSARMGPRRREGARYATRRWKWRRTGSRRRRGPPSRHRRLRRALRRSPRSPRPGDPRRRSRRRTSLVPPRVVPRSASKESQPPSKPARSKITQPQIHYRPEPPELPPPPATAARPAREAPRRSRVRRRSPSRLRGTAVRSRRRGAKPASPEFARRLDPLRPRPHRDGRIRRLRDLSAPLRKSRPRSPRRPGFSRRGSSAARSRSREP